jgi:hypothetical protein
MDSLIIGLKQLSKVCPKLRSLNVINCRLTSEPQFIGFMNQLKQFKELKRLEIEFEINSQITENCFNNSMKSGFENLTHLRIGFSDSIDYRFNSLVLNETLLTDFYKYLPKLQTFNLKNSIEVTEKTADILSRLSNLETLELNIVDHTVCQSFKNKIIEKCRKIKSIQL